MTPTKTVLVCDGLDISMESVGERVRKLGFQPIRAKTPQEAFEIAEERRGQIGAIVVAPDLMVVDLPGAIADLCTAASEDTDVDCVALGPRPPENLRDELRSAGIARVLWQPFSDGALRFQLNRAMAGPEAGQPRGELRVPARVPARVWLSGRHKPAKTYTISATGAFLETGRPSMRGARIGLQMQMARGAVELDARVVYTNVPGNLHKWNLPVGMAVEFLTVPPQDEERIRACVSETALQLKI